MYSTLRSIAFLVLAAAAACSSPDPGDGASDGVAFPANASPADLEAERDRVAGIAWGRPTRRLMGEQLSCTGVVEVPPYSLGSVYAPVHGWVKEVRHLPGQYVRKGERLTVLEHPDIIRMQRELLASSSRLTALEKDYTRKRSLADTEAASRRALEQAQAEFETERSLFESLKAELSIVGLPVEELLTTGEIRPRLALRAPIGGFLNEVNINLGKLVQPEELLFEIIDTRHIHLELQLYARDLARVREGLRVEAAMPGSDSTYQAEVYLVGKMVDAETKTAMVHAHFSEEPVPLTPGTYLQARVYLGDREVEALPEEAIVRSADRAYAFVREGEDISRVEVSLGQRADGFIEVLDLMLPPGGEVALRGAYYLNGQYGEGD